MTRDQSAEIYTYIIEHPGCSTEDIVQGAGWNRHLVELATQMMVQELLIKPVGKAKWGDTLWEIVRHRI